jgi:pyruvate kinase
VNTPDSVLEISPLTPKDRSDLEYMLGIGVDWVALSFVQRPEDIVEIHELIDKLLPEGMFKPAVMAKIEKPSCFVGDSLVKIVELCDGIMVARGDLGVECAPEDVPLLQKEIIDTCRALRKPVTVATQMLESMIDSPTPTRAEASDVATAIYDGADAIMLSAESAAGKVSLLVLLFSFIGVTKMQTMVSLFQCLSLLFFSKQNVVPGRICCHATAHHQSG